MCGIAGIWEQGGSACDLDAAMTRMTDALAHRGPDDDGVWTDRERGLALGFRRLAIIDLTQEGHQPMLSPGGRYVMVFNGEVYNFAEMRPELEAAGVRFRGRSDTEVILAAIEQWGLDAVQRFVGMFAIALWDRQEAQLTLIRDRLGIKPLYAGWARQTFLFGSELKALRAYPGPTPEIDREALTLYMRYGYVPAPHSIYRGIFQVRPGTMLTIDADGRTEERAYWSLREAALAGTGDPWCGGDEEAIDLVDDAVGRAVRLRMVADVPLGAFLSGGIDSSVVVAQMQAASSRPIKTFTIGFHEAGFDEAGHARDVARHLGTDHTELYVTPAEARDVIPRLPHIYDEPFADPSQIPTFLVSALARRSVTVSLSGDGGDELFAGYRNYRSVPAIWASTRRVPLPLRRATRRALDTRVYSRWHRRFPLPPHLARPVDRALKLAGILDSPTAETLTHAYYAHWPRPESLVLGGREALPVEMPPLPSLVDRLMYRDALTYLPDDILTKVDRASMAVSLEARVPLLDHRLVELAWRLPLSLKMRDGQGKWVLRRVLDRYVPPELVERPKMGFGVPIAAWLRGPLREWAESLLDEDRLSSQGLLDPAQVRERWEDHLSGARNWQSSLWNVLMFQAWLDTWCS